MATHCLLRMLGKHGYACYRADLSKIRKAIDDHRYSGTGFTLRGIFRTLSLVYKEEGYIRSRIEANSSQYLSSLKKQGLVKSVKKAGRNEYRFVQNPEITACEAQALDHHIFFKQNRDRVHQLLCRGIEDAPPGAALTIRKALASLGIPALQVPGLHKKFVGLAANVFVQYRRSGALTAVKHAGNDMIFFKANNEAI